MCDINNFTYLHNINIDIYKELYKYHASLLDNSNYVFKLCPETIFPQHMELDTLQNLII
jgi:hypothetical protein